MIECMKNGAELGWLIDPIERRVNIYRPHAAVECLADSKGVGGEPVLRKFELDLSEIW